MASSIQSQIDSVQSSLNIAKANLASAQSSATDACGNKDNCSSWIPFTPNCYTDTGNPADQKDQSRCSSSKNNIITYQAQVNTLTAQLAGLKKIQTSSSSITKEVIIWSLVIIAVGLGIFFFGRYKKWWG